MNWANCSFCLHRPRSAEKGYVTMQTRSINRDIQKLVWVSLTALAAVCIIFTAKQHFESTMSNRATDKQNVLEEVFSLETQFLMARRAEKDFLLRKDPKYIDRHAAIAQEMIAQVDLIDEQAQGILSAETAQDMAGLRTAVETYIRRFSALFDANMMLGLDEETGLQGTLRSAVKTAETSLEELDNPVMQVKMLMMRRHEKDFIMRGGQKYIDRLNARVAEFREFPARFYTSSDVQDQVLTLMGDYQTAFNEYAVVYGEETQARAAVSAAFAEAEPFLESLKNIIGEEVAATRDTAVMVSNSVLVGSAIAVLATALLFFAWAKRVSRRIIRPWHETVEVVNGLADGHADIETLKHHYIEVANVADAFEGFHEAILAKEASERKNREHARLKVEKAEQRVREEKEAAEMQKRREQEAQIAAEREIVAEISNVIDACAAGDFTQRLVTDNKEGALAQLCSGVNKIGEVANNGLTDVREALTALSAGDLKFRMQGAYAGIFEEISVTMNATADTLAAIVGQIDNSSETISVSTRELASASSELAKRTEKNAASLEEAAAATEELSASVKSTADTASGVSGEAGNMKKQVDDSLNVVTKTVDAMEGIRNASAEITKITGLIDDIAFQTNLLALNAGVEAARAGEAGKGFAVVATEVRALAGRSAEAAQNISNLIEESAKQVEKGGNLVDDTGKSLEEIAQSVEGVVRGIEEIALSAQQQATTISEITATTSELDRATQSNAAMFEETAAASQSLQEEARALSGTVSSFTGHNSAARESSKTKAEGEAADRLAS